jgi:hypothetical protein
MATSFKRIRKGVYESTSVPKKVDENRVRQIIDREPPRRQRREEPVNSPRPVTVQAG